MDFSYPQEADQFRKELRAWLSAHLTQAVIDKMVAAGQKLGRLKVYALSRVGVATRVTLE